MRKVIVIGGGITGLSAAYRLQRGMDEGIPVDYLLIERDRRLGGKILTEYLNGFTIEGGPDCFVSDKPWVGELSQELGITDRLLGSNEENKGTFVLSGGKLHRLPEGLMALVPTRFWPFVTTGLISWPGKLRMALDLVIPPRRSDDDESLASFVTRRLGREALEKIAEPLIGGIHAGDPETMSVKASFPRFIQMEQKYGSLTRAMLAARKRTVPNRNSRESGSHRDPYPGGRRTYFMSFIEGMGELPATLAARLDPRRVVTGKRVIRLTRGSGGSYEVILDDGGRITGDAVIIATLANDSANLMMEIDPDVSDTLSKITLMSSATISLAFRKNDMPSGLEGFGLVIPQVEKRKIMAVTYSSAKWKYRVPSDEYFLLRVFIGGPANQGMIAADEKEIMEIVRREIADILNIKAEPLLYKLYRWEKAMSQYTLGHLDRMAFIEQRLKDHPGLFLAGGSYRGIGIGDCSRDGQTAAQEALAFLKG